MNIASFLGLSTVALAYGYFIAPNYSFTVNVVVGAIMGFAWGVVWPLVEKKK